MRVHTYVQTFIYICVLVYMRVFICVYVCIHKHLYICNTRIWVFVCIYYTLGVNISFDFDLDIFS